MKITKELIEGKGIKFLIEIDGKVVGRAFLYILNNNLHKKPFGFLEDVFIEKDLRGKGIGTELLNKVIDEAKRNKCYKIVALGFTIGVLNLG